MLQRIAGGLCKQTAMQMHTRVSDHSVVLSLLVKGCQFFPTSSILLTYSSPTELLEQKAS